MRNWKIAALALLAAGLVLLLCGCGTIVDEEILNTQANTAVEIQVPYATATPLPEHLNVPDAIVIDSDGNVILYDRSVIEGDFQSARDQEEQTEYRSLSLGNTGIAVQALQQRLKELGYFDGDVSGLFDADTENAVKRFEQTYGTMQTGVATAKLQLKLFAASAPVYGTQEYNDSVISQYAVLRPGTVGSSVYALQQRLKNLNYPIATLTGVFDDQTAECVRLFYAAYGLASSDVANVAMQMELYSESARVYDPSIRITTTLAPSDVTLPEGIVPEDDGEVEASAIALGNSGTRVMQIQRRLIALGYMPEGGDTGVFDEATQQAVNRFLSAIGRPANGMLTMDMQEFLLSDRAPEYGGVSAIAEYADLSAGDSGEAVMNLQRRLVELIDSLDVLEYTRSKDSFLAPVQNKAPYEVDYQRKRVILTIIDAYSLTEREGYVLRFLANGHNAAYIAEGLFVSLATVRSHINAIYRKLGVHSVKELGEFIDAYVIEE